MKKHLYSVLFFSVLIINCYGLPPRTVVKDSTINNYVEGDYTAVNRSKVNSGVEAKGAYITDSNISNKTKGSISAYNGSSVNAGVRANNTAVINSNLSANSNVNVKANHSNVNTGIDVTHARNANISTNVDANIKATNSNVNVGSVSGSVKNKSISTNVSAGVNARNQNVNIGSVSVNGGRTSSYRRSGVPQGHKSNTNIGNVTVNSNSVREVNTVVGSSGSSSLTQKIKTRHKAKVYSDTGGVDSSGVKHVYVSKRERRKAERKRNGGAGNTYIGSGSDVKGVNTYVE